MHTTYDVDVLNSKSVVDIDVLRVKKCCIDTGHTNTHHRNLIFCIENGAIIYCVHIITHITN